MKRIKCLAILFLFALPLWSKNLILPEDSASFSKDSALALLELSTGHSQKITQKLFTDYDFSTIKQVNYDRPLNQIDHSSAYSISRGKVLINGKSRDSYLVVIRGTDGSEWFSNFDFAPGKSSQSHFAMGNLISAEDIFLDLHNLIKDKNSVIILAGHSRGAGVANVLGLLLNQAYNPKNIYVYTYATPYTIRALDNLEESNIFNLLNPCDLVPQMPAKDWGFRRAGKDIILDSQSKNISAEEITLAVKSIYNICPSIESYYQDRHSLTQAGLSSDGLTMYEVMMTLSAELSKLTVNNFQSDLSDLNQEDIVNLNSNVTEFSLPSLDLASDFSPLLLYFSKLFGNNGKGFEFLLDEHLPQTYKIKISRMDDVELKIEE